MRYLTLALVAVFGIVTSNADAQCIGCGHHVGGAPITCDYNYLWDNFSPTQCRYEPRPGMPCGGCRLGCGKLLGQFAGACRSKTSGCCNDNCCSTPSPNIGWDGWGHLLSPLSRIAAAQQPCRRGLTYETGSIHLWSSRKSVAFVKS
jgi:hypothetical protein